MVLVKVGELVVQEDRVLEICRDVKLHDALPLVEDVGDCGIAGVIEEGIARGGWFGTAVR